MVRTPLGNSGHRGSDATSIPQRLRSADLDQVLLDVAADLDARRLTHSSIKKWLPDRHLGVKISGVTTIILQPGRAPSAWQRTQQVLFRVVAGETVNGKSNRAVVPRQDRQVVETDQEQPPPPFVRSRYRRFQH